MYVYVAIAIIAALSAATGTWKVQEWRYGAKEAQRLEQAREDRAMREKTIDHAAVGHEKDRGALRTEFITITQEVERVIEKPFYVASELCLDGDGLRELNAARTPAALASQPARAVPGLAPGRWWQPRREPEKQD
jgi:hypothetical protein